MNKILKKDIIIPKGTIFECIDGRSSEYVSGNYSYLFGLTKDSTGELICGIDDLDKNLDEWFGDEKIDDERN